MIDNKLHFTNWQLKNIIDTNLTIKTYKNGSMYFLYNWLVALFPLMSRASLVITTTTKISLPFNPFRFWVSIADSIAHTCRFSTQIKKYKYDYATNSPDNTYFNFFDYWTHLHVFTPGQELTQVITLWSFHKEKLFPWILCNVITFFVCIVLNALPCSYDWFQSYEWTNIVRSRWIKIASTFLGTSILSMFIFAIRTNKFTRFWSIYETTNQKEGNQ